MQHQSEFKEIADLIRQAKMRVAKTVNHQLVDLYWQLGASISSRVISQQWGRAVVTQLAVQQIPNTGGLSDKNLWRMKQFYEMYKDLPKLSALLREISWTNHLMIISKTRSLEEKTFYLELTARERYSSRELERQLNSSYFERVMLTTEKLAPVVRELPQDVKGLFSFYVNVLNDLVRLPHENPSIGILLCKEKAMPSLNTTFRALPTKWA